MFVIRKLIIFNCGFSTKVTCVFLMQDIVDEQSKLKNENYLPHYLSDEGFLCASSIAIFAWKATEMYAYSPL